MTPSFARGFSVCLRGNVLAIVQRIPTTVSVPWGRCEVRFLWDTIIVFKVRNHLQNPCNNNCFFFLWDHTIPPTKVIKQNGSPGDCSSFPIPSPTWEIGPSSSVKKNKTSFIIGNKTKTIGERMIWGFTTSDSRNGWVVIERCISLHHIFFNLRKTWWYWQGSHRTLQQIQSNSVRFYNSFILTFTHKNPVIFAATSYNSPQQLPTPLLSIYIYIYCKVLQMWDSMTIHENIWNEQGPKLRATEAVMSNIYRFRQFAESLYIIS